MQMALAVKRGTFCHHNVPQSPIYICLTLSNRLHRTALKVLWSETLKSVIPVKLRYKPSSAHK